MVTSATWVDYDKEAKLDLVVVGEGMPVRVFTRKMESSSTGRRRPDLPIEWWGIQSAVDLAWTMGERISVGDLGLNSYLRASKNEPARLYVGDFGHTGGLSRSHLLQERMS